MEPFDLAVVGGGAAGFMTAIIAAENGVKRIIILEGTSKLMEKVRISGGGRCNVTNATWVPNELVENYPRGGIQLLEAFNRFAAGDVFDWFEKRGLKLKIEDDLRVFPESNSSSDVIDCLRKSALSKKVEILTKFFVKEILKTPDNIFNIFSLKKEKVISKNVILSTGGHPSGYKLAANLGHSIVKPVPSLFTFSTKEPNLEKCRGVSIKDIDIEIKLKNKTFYNRGDLLITHWGFSGPAVLKLSSIAARELFSQKYKFNLIIKWSVLSFEELKEKINYLRLNKGKVNLINSRPVPLLTKRLWIFLLNKIGLDKEKKWSDLMADERDKMINILMKDKYIISGKGPFGEEFVTSGGVKINEVSFKSMESLICPGLFFSGEVLDVDGITGGFNFQHCWTSGWIAGIAVSKLNNKVTNQ
ncbi:MULTISPECIES: NAD(P)/FAD-dependent oxidoreductase [Prochlorococcus]|uniref:Flavoprotein n=1 Tax=Prochlorococcus marinus str. MIT 9116 TaxID=167544 RepID=A0A0A1ZZV2_PROMR|nr:NAD(P)/FAD-dependent oxidoreductase [Prochlorococcus marinus]KGF91589.1 hypothetical protein EU92_0331 [Prochlorococcus marinus str. MIT 9107]KGF93809.1 hypothetical protein EU93_0003 [Prochlorococcus marinus str. MIT 9116]KGF94181.1 hypothetical protein EU94_0768 [Prochlorococcus marinus str. MIT 9123]